MSILKMKKTFVVALQKWAPARRNPSLLIFLYLPAFLIP